MVSFSCLISCPSSTLTFMLYRRSALLLSTLAAVLFSLFLVSVSVSVSANTLQLSRAFMRSLCTVSSVLYFKLVDCEIMYHHRSRVLSLNHHFVGLCEYPIFCVMFCGRCREVVDACILLNHHTHHAVRGTFGRIDFRLRYKLGGLYRWQ